MLRGFSSLLLLLLGLSACTPLPRAVRQESTPSPARTATPTALFQAPEHALPDAPPASNNPIALLFPTPAPPPDSAWRPPLYPVPWALRPQDHFLFTRPIPVNKPNWPLASYRYGGVFFDNVVHTGVDIPSPSGTDVLAAGPGTVVWAGYGLFAFTPGYQDDPYGLAVAIRHDFGYRYQPLYTVYAHMSAITVIEGQHVEEGQKIGEVGETGFTTGPHLHFEVRVGQNSFFNTRNPELWTAPPQGWGVLAGQVLDDAGQSLPSHPLYVTSLEDQRTWVVMSYGGKAVKPDSYYQENLAMGDLPAGDYRLETVYNEQKFFHTIHILPGVVSTFRFRGSQGFLPSSPAVPDAFPAP